MTVHVVHLLLFALHAVPLVQLFLLDEDLPTVPFDHNEIIVVGFLAHLVMLRTIEMPRLISRVLVFMGSLHRSSSKAGLLDATGRT